MEDFYKLSQWNFKKLSLPVLLREKYDYPNSVLCTVLPLA